MRLSAPLILLMLASVSWQPATHAQLQPDNTLGTEASRVIRTQPEAAEIGGGAQRGDNLFHSFREFNVEAGGRVYFQDSAAIENILTRVTGDNASNILGTLGVLGDANLFLLNPNGIIFGPDATLDIDGSFTATTAEAFLFPGGEVFSAVNPDAPPLLTMSVPIGLQHNTAGQGVIENQGWLTVGQNLTLDGNRLQLTGRLQAGQDLTLQAQGTLTVRDTAAVPFIATSGQNLLLQGNQGVDIFALNHPDSGLFAGNDLTLRSPTPVIGDAHYWSGGHFRIEQLDGALGALTSPNDPVIRATGDVAFDSYTGASLHIFAGGSVTVPGAITITGPDPVNGIVETVTLSDGSTVEINGQTTPTLDIRAGTLAVNPAGAVGDTTGLVPGVPATGGAATGANITLGSIRNEGGTVFLTNQYQPNLGLPGGDMTVGAIDTSAEGEVTVAIGGFAELQVWGGDVVLDSSGRVDLLGAIDTTANGRTANPIVGDVEAEIRGGAIQILANDPIRVQDLSTSTTVNLRTRDELPTDGLATDAEAIAQSGSIFLRSQAEITTGDFNTTAVAQISSDASAQAFERQVTAGEIGQVSAIAQGGALSLDAQAQITVGTLDTSGNATITANAGARAASGSQTEQIVVTADGGSIERATVIATGGTLDINTQGGVLADGLQSQATAMLDDLIVGGEAGADADLDGQAISQAEAGEVGQARGEARGGAIEVNAIAPIEVNTATTAASVSLSSQLSSLAFSTNNGPETQALSFAGRIGSITSFAQGGAIAFTTEEAINAGDLTTSVLNQVSTNASAVTRSINPTLVGGDIGPLEMRSTGGDITLNTQTSIVVGNLNSNVENDITPFVFTDFNDLDGTIDPVLSVSGNIGEIDISSTGGAIALTSQQDMTTNAVNASTNSTLFALIGDSPEDAEFGQVILNDTAGNLNLSAQTNLITFSLNTSSNFSSRSTIEFDNRSERLTQAQGGTITLTSRLGTLQLLEKSRVLSGVSGSDGNGGTIQLFGMTLQLTDALLTTTVTGEGNSGDITARVGDRAFINGSRLLTGRESGAEGQGAGGRITLNAGTLDLTNFAFLNTATFGSGSAGDVSLTTSQGDITLNNSSIFSLTAGAGDAGRILIQPATTLRLQGNSIVSTAVALGSSGAGGDIIVNAPTGVFIEGTGETISNSNIGTQPQLNEIEPNNVFLLNRNNRFVFTSPEEAQSIDGFFSLLENPNVIFPTEIPYVSINGEINDPNISNFSFDTYTFEVDAVGTQVTFDMDEVTAPLDPVTNARPEPANTVLRLYDERGNELAFNDDAPISLGEQGSTSPNDAYLTYIFNEPGQYFIRVSEFFEDGREEGPLRTVGRYTLNISRVDDLLVSSGITTQTRSTGRSGNISIQAPIINIQNGGQISAETLSSGQAGDITLSPFGTGQILTVNIEGEGSQISGSTLDAGAGGNLTLASPGRINLRGDGALRVETSATGAAGNVAISTPTLAVQDPLSISATATETATPSGQPGGNINVNVSTLNFFAPATLTAETEGRAPAGRMTFRPYEADDSITVNFRDSGAVISTSTSAAGVGGTLQLRAPGAITLQGNGQLLAETAGAGRAGDIRVETAQFALRDGVEVSTSTEGTGVGGTIFVNGLQNQPAEQVILQAAELSAETDSAASAGDIRIRTGALVMGNNAEITTSTNDAGDGGDIFIDAGNRMQLSNATILAESNPIDDETDAPVTQTPGDAGQIRIATPRLALQNGAQISASNVSSRSEGIRLRALRELALTGGSQILASTDTGSAGNISVDASGGTVLLQGAGTRLAAETETETPSATSQAGTISITTSQFNVQDQAEVSISTQDGTGGDLSLMVDDLVVSDGRMLAQTNNGVAGSLTVNSPDRPADSVVLRGGVGDRTPAGLSVEATGARGVAGQVQLNVRHLTVQENAEITAANQAGRSDGIFLSRLERLNLQSGGRITASTARGQAGNITLALDPGGIVRLDNGQIESAATAGGEAGSLTLQNSRTVDLSNGSSISVSSPQGLAGRLSVTTEQLVLNNSQITAQTGRTSTNPGEANIQLQGLELLVMQSNSLISAQALGDATGGNVAIDAPNGFVIGVPQENNDIIATAEAGNGGNINIRAIRIFGFVDRTPDGLSFAALRGNTTNDISASSEFGTSGSVVLDNLSVDPSQGLTALPETVVDAANQIGQVCPTGPGASEQLGRFVVTGRGGISPSPLGLQEDLGFSIDWMPDANPAAPTSDVNSAAPTEAQAPIAEADGWQVDAEGRVQLVSTTAPAMRVGTAVQCP